MHINASKFNVMCIYIYIFIFIIIYWEKSEVYDQPRLDFYTRIEMSDVQENSFPVQMGDNYH